VHLERPLWLVWVAPSSSPAGLIWRAYSSRWTIECGVRFRKERLGWTLPRFQCAETGDRWTQLAHWVLYLARLIVPDRPRKRA